MHSFKTFREAYELLERADPKFAKAQKALKFASKAHRKQSRSDGKAYITHPYEVASIVKQFKQSNNIDDLVAAAYLHDTLEDTNATMADLTKMFGGLVASMVKELTSDKDVIDKKGKTDYLKDKMANMSSWSLVVKLADRLHNVSDLSTAKSEDWAKKYKAQTISILNDLEKRRDLSQTHKNMITAIRKKMDEFKK